MSAPQRPAHPRTRGDLRRLIQRAETAASVLRTPGHRFSGTGERQAIAELLEGLAVVARRRLDPDYAPQANAHDGGEDVVTDLFGEGA